jgi:CHAT domain-containing protein/Tfp pilus assembly protein PilF
VAAGAYGVKGNYNQAEEMLEQQLRFVERIDDMRRTELEGDVYSNLGNLYLYRNEPDIAAEYYRKAEALWNIVGEKMRISWSMANIYHNLGLCSSRKNDHQTALKMHEISLGIKQKLFQPESNIIGISYNEMGSAFLAMKDFDHALHYFEKALGIAVASHGQKHFSVGHCQANVASVYAERNDHDRAIQEFTTALEVLFSTRGPEHPDVATVHQLIGDCYLDQEKYEIALVHYQKALSAVVPDFADTNAYTNPNLDRVLSDPVLLDILVRKGDAFSRLAAEGANPLRNLLASLDVYHLGVKLVERIRTDLVARSSKIMLTEKTADIHHHAAEIAIKLFEQTSDPRFRDEAFSFMEKGKTAVLADALAESEARRFAGIPDSLLRKEKDLRIELTYYDTKIQQQRQGNKEEISRKMTSLEDRRLHLWREYESLIEDLESTYTDYNRLRLQEQPGGAAQVQKALEAETCLLEYSLGDTTLLMCVISNDAAHVLRIQIDTTLERLVDQFLLSIKKLEPDLYRASAAALYNVIIDPVRIHISPHKRLIVVPDGKLCYVPFEALLAPDTEIRTNRRIAAEFTALPYLINSFSISYHYSAGLFLARTSEERGTKRNGFVGFAPVFAEGTTIEYRKKRWGNNEPLMESDRAAVIGGMRFSDLPSSEEEVLRIANLVQNKGGSAQTYLHREANEQNFKSIASNELAFMHVATHGVLNEEVPSLSGLAFYPPGDSANREDGILFADECYNLELDANLLVLSSCETGLGTFVRGEGVMAMTRGFLYSGARNIVLSLWKVPDESTRSLMVEFYRTILASGARTFADALREAKLHLISKSRTSFPKHWAGFVLLGM